MEQDKKKILSDLYAIRATMSLIAENDDCAEPERQAITDLEQEQRIVQNSILNSEKTLGLVLYRKRKYAKERMEKLRKKRESKQKTYEFYQRCANATFSSDLWETLWHHLFVGCFLGVLLVILIVVSVALSFTLGDVWNCSIAGLDNYWSGVLITATICLAGICAYFFGICVPLTVHERKWCRINIGAMPCGISTSRPRT